MSDTPICLFHYPCLDGFTAAWAAWRAHPDWAFHRTTFGENAPNVAGRDVYLLDFSYPRSGIEQILGSARSVTILDHHQTAIDALEPMLRDGYIHGTLDPSRSGARLAWDWFHPCTTEPPILLAYIEDHDLGENRFHFTRDIQAAIAAYEYSFAVWDKLMLYTPTQDLAREGRVIRRLREKNIRELIDTAQRRMVIAGHDVPALNAPYFLSDDAGHLMAQGEAFAACYYDTGNERVFSLRSTPNGADVADIADRYEGGGSRHRAAFRAPIGWEGE